MVIRVSLKEALRERPGKPGRLSQGYTKADAALISRRHTKADADWIVSRAVASLNAYRPQLITCRPMWEEADFRTYANLLEMVIHPTDGVPTIMAQSWLDGFKRKHGVEKCDMMLAELRRRDAQAFFDKKQRNGS